MARILIILIVFSITLFSSCKNGPGPGGQASISGRVYAYGNFTDPGCNYLDSSSGFIPFYAPDEDVYLIYGDDPSYGERVKTAPDGTYKFNYLRKGKYRVYVYSNEACDLVNFPSGKNAISTDIEITDRKQATTLSNLRINK